MSHGDRIERMPPGFRSIAHTGNSPIAAMKRDDHKRRIYCLQFHPEVVHTPEGTRLLRNFVYDICGCQPTWTMQSYVDTAVQQIREQVGKERVICALSGGVDSSVVAASDPSGHRRPADLYLRRQRRVCGRVSVIRWRRPLPRRCTLICGFSIGPISFWRASGM